MNSDLVQIVKFMNGMYGGNISRYDETFLLKSVEKRMAATTRATIAEYCTYLSEDKGEAEAFLRSLNITYSEFFRNPLTFAVLEQRVLPRLIEKKLESGAAEIRIWSAGCAAGQEVFSVAILLDELLSARKTSLSFRIFATDIAETALAAAQSGVYDAAAVQNVRLKHIRSSFSEQNGSYTIARRIRERIEFSRYDLLDERSTSPPCSIYGDFDLVFCSNLLFYYTPAIRQFILNKVCHSLSDGGFLVTGETERSDVEMINLDEISPMSGVYQKSQIGKVMI
jgi:chemotaxis protein methyltransferase CheR